MKLWLWLTGGAVILFAWLALRGPDPASGPATVVKTAALPQEAPRATPVPAAAEPQPRGIRVHGVLFRGARDPGSQALLSVEGQPAQGFRIGEAVAQGWSLESVAPDHVVLALGPARARLEVSYSAKAPEAAAAVPVSLPVAAPEAAPGLRPLPEGAPPLAVPPAQNGNRAFKEAMQKRQAGAR